jgi:DNA-binding IclR family transcriptional regulator
VAKPVRPVRPRARAVDPADKNRILTYQKMVDVLGCFSTVNRHLSLAQIAQATSLPRATTHRILSALREVGFIEQDSRGAEYSLGVRLFELGSLALANMDLHREAKPYADRLARLVEETVHLGVFNGQAIVVVEREEHAERPARASSVLETAPAHCTGLGKAVLAFQDKSVIDRLAADGLKAFTAATITTRPALDRELARIRKQGYSTDKGEHQLFVNCVAAPIRNGSGRVFAAISVTGSAARITEDRVPVLSGVVIEAAKAISRHLGNNES